MDSTKNAFEFTTLINGIHLHIRASRNAPWEHERVYQPAHLHYAWEAHYVYEGSVLLRIAEQENATTLLPFLDEFAATRADRPLLQEELDMTREVLTHYKEYGMDGILLRIGDRIAAFACGEIIGDTLSVHIEKADTRIAGSYQRIVSAFASRYDPVLVPHLNREDDMGEEGLRTSKLSYHPTAILDKWRIKVL